MSGLMSTAKVNNRMEKKKYSVIKYINQRGNFRGETKQKGTKTLISRMETSVSAVKDVSPLPLREDVPPREVRVAPDIVDAREEP